MKTNTPFRKIEVAKCKPNDWNPNVVTPAYMKKLRKGIETTLEASGGTIPPIVVRPHPTKKKRFQIIDGFHRWKVFQDIGLEKIDAYIIDADDKLAMSLTATLNYLRGEPEPEKYADFVGRILNENKITTEDLAAYLPESSEELDMLIENYEIKLDELVMPEPEEGETVEEKKPSETWVELKFLVSAGQAEIIEAELARISSVLEGKNARGRSLEFMAVNSADTPLKSIVGESGAEKKTKRLKSKKDRAEETSH